jgi:carboxyl-terminal processing protease
MQTSEVRKRKMDNRLVSLNEKVYKKELDENNEISKKLDDIQKKATTLETVSLQLDKERINADSTAMKKSADWLKSISKDIYIAETVNIVNDLRKTSMRVSTGMK